MKYFRGLMISIMTNCKRIATTEFCSQGLVSCYNVIVATILKILDFASK